MKGKHNGGFSLVECLVAIALLGALMIPTCTGLIMSVRMNGKTDELMQAQLAVSSAVETLMAEGIPDDLQMDDTSTAEIETSVLYEEERFSNVTVIVTGKDESTIESKKYYGYYEVRVTSEVDTSVSVSTCIRAVEAAAEEVGG